LYNSTSCDLGGFTEVINPGAFDRCLSTNPDVACLHEHDRKQGLLGRTTSGTLHLSIESIGLRFERDFPYTTLGNDVAESISRQNLAGCSFGFVCNDDFWVSTQDGMMLRTLLDVELFEVTMTSCPAYEATSVALRSKMFPDGTPVAAVEPTAAEKRDGDDEEKLIDCQCGCDACQADNLCYRRRRTLPKSAGFGRSH
jgi:HK97 family phage prohead protease